jgi:ERCC4-type nuclease
MTSGSEEGEGMTRTITADFPIVIDTREQLPYVYPGATVATLTTGDYSIAGHQDRIAVERKSFTDLCGCIGHDRDRFRLQCERLGALECGVLLIEATPARILMGHDLSRVHPSAIINTVVKWSVELDFHVLFADNREIAEALCYRVLEGWVKKVEKEDEGKPTA